MGERDCIGGVLTQESRPGQTVVLSKFATLIKFSTKSEVEELDLYFLANAQAETVVKSQARHPTYDAQPRTVSQSVGAGQRFAAGLTTAGRGGRACVCVRCLGGTRHRPDGTRKGQRRLPASTKGLVIAARYLFDEDDSDEF